MNLRITNDCNEHDIDAMHALLKAYGRWNFCIMACR